jgi:hypothetical protein
MTATGDLAARSEEPKQGFLARWWRRRGARRRKIEHAVWDLRERYGEAAYSIARASSRQPVGDEGKRFWRKVAGKLKRLG